jgi:hypothetical protein
MLEVKPTLNVQDDQGNMDDDAWRSWKRRHNFSSSSWDFLLSQPQPKFFSLRLSNDAKLKRANTMGDKFADEVILF